MRRLINPAVVGRTILRHNYRNIAFVLALGFILAMPLVLYTTVQNYLDHVKDAKSIVYGRFTDIFYADAPGSNDEFWQASEAASEKYLPGFQYETCGSIYAVAQKQMGDTEIRLGYLDSPALDLAKIRIMDGNLPVNSDEIACTRSAAQALTGGAVIGGKVIIDREYTIVGIVQDFGRLWVKGEKQIQGQQAMVNMFVSLERAREISQAQPASRLGKMLLYRRNPSQDRVVQPVSGSFYFNDLVQTAQQESVLSVPIYYGITLMLAMGIVIAGIFIMASGAMRSRYRIYQYLGMTSGETKANRVFELILISLMSLLAGTVISFLISLALHVQIEWAIGTTYPMRLSTGHFIFFSIIFLALCLACIFLLSVANPNSHRRPNQPRRSRSPSSFLKLLVWDARQTPLTFVALILAMAIAAGLFSFNAIYLERFRTVATPKAVDGKMPFDFDYELITYGPELLAGTVVRDGKAYALDKSKKTVYFANSVIHDGMPQAFVEKLARLPGVRQVRAYREVDDLLTHLPENGMDQYLTDFFATPPIGAVTKRVFSLDQPLVKSKLWGYSLEEIQGFGKYVTEGRIDEEALLSGREVVLMVPAYRTRSETETLPDGSEAVTQFYDPAPYDAPGVLNSTTFKVGDEVRVTSLYPRESIYGALNETELIETHERKDLTVRIGAIIRTYAGWFEDMHAPWTGFTYLTAADAFKNWGLDASYNRIRVYVEPSADYSFLDAEIGSLSASFPYVRLRNFHEELVTFHAYERVFAYFASVLTIVLALVATITISSLISSRIRLMRRSICLLRLNGLSLNGLISMYVLQHIACIVAAILVAVPLDRLLFQTVLRTEVTMFSMQNVRLLLVPWAIILLAILGNDVVAMHAIKKGGLVPER